MSLGYIVYYRKPEFQKDYWPWKEAFDNYYSAKSFVMRLGPEYEVRVFKEMGKQALKTFLPLKREVNHEP